MRGLVSADRAFHEVPPKGGFARRGCESESKKFIPGQRLLRTGIRKAAAPQRRAFQSAARQPSQTRFAPVQLPKDRSASPSPRFGGLAAPKFTLPAAFQESLYVSASAMT